MAWTPLYFLVALAGWLVPLIFIFVTLMAGTIFLAAAVSVLDGLFETDAAQGSGAA